MIGANELLFLACLSGLICSVLAFVYFSKKWWKGHENVWRKRYNSAAGQTLQKEHNKRGQEK
jgi:hypothetical protein